jgi:hypothetical protein
MEDIQLLMRDLDDKQIGSKNNIEFKFLIMFYKFYNIPKLIPIINGFLPIFS